MIAYRYSVPLIHCYGVLILTSTVRTEFLAEFSGVRQLFSLVPTRSVLRQLDGEEPIHTPLDLGSDAWRNIPGHST